MTIATDQYERLVGYGGSGESPVFFVVTPCPVSEFMNRAPFEPVSAFVDAFQKSFGLAETGNVRGTHNELERIASVNAQFSESGIGLLGLEQHARYVMSIALRGSRNTPAAQLKEMATKYGLPNTF